MNLILSQLIRAAIDTLRAPRDGAKRVLAIDMARRDRWQVLFLVATLSAIFAYLSLILGQRSGTAPLIVINPIMLGVTQLMVMLVMVFAVYLVGRLAGGTGTLDDAILLVSWLHFILLLLQILQIVALLFMPLLGFGIGVAGLVLLFVLTTVFVAELHGFKSMGAVFVSVLGVMVILATIMRVVFSALGLNVIGVL